VIYPSGSWSEYYSKERIAKREAAAEASGTSSAEFARLFSSMVAWHEDVYVEGPPLDIFRVHVKDAGLLHFEIMQALPGKRETLVEEFGIEPSPPLRELERKILAQDATLEPARVATAERTLLVVPSSEDRLEALLSAWAVSRISRLILADRAVLREPKMAMPTM
jgi:hypothetical protein